MGFLLETLLGGLMAGVLYSLGALGCVLIFKAGGFVNFAQGAMVLFAALVMARFAESLPVWAAFAGAMLVMIVFAWLVETLCLSRLADRQGLAPLMATLGIAYVLDGLGRVVFGIGPYRIDVGLPKDSLVLLESIFEGGLLVHAEDLCAALIAATLVVASSLVFRAPTRFVAWSIAGFIALVAGILWGNTMGVQPSLSLVALKALPIVVLGGLGSVPGAIVGGLVVGVGEKLSATYLGPLLGGGIEAWFVYALALMILLLRPQGLFGEKTPDRA